MFKKYKYPVVRQYDQVDCAPASLLSVLRYYKGDDNLFRVRELCKTSMQGSTIFNLVQAAQKLGFNAAGVTGEYEDLMNEKMPCIAHVILENKLRHYLVVYKIDDKGLLIGDPGKGLLELSKNEFQKIWHNKAVVLLQPNSKIHKGINPKWYNWILNYLEKEVNWIIQSLFLGIIYTILGLFTALFIQTLIDQFIPQKDYSRIGYSSTILFLLLLVRAFSGYVRQRFSIELNKRISLNINSEFITHLFKLPKSFFDTRKTGDITARIHDTIRIQQTILLIINTTIIDGLIIIGSLIYIYYFSSLLASVMLGVIPIYSFILWFNSRKLKQKQLDVMRNYSLLESTYIDSLIGIDEIFNFNGGSAFSTLNQAIFKNFQNKIENLGIARSKLALFAELFSAIITISILLMGAIVIIEGNLLLGEMMAAYSLFANILPSVSRFVDANISLQGASGASQRLLDMLLLNKEPNISKQPFKLEKSLKIRNGVFSWSGDKKLLNQINLNLQKGKISALWGKSGSGKSTLIQIIQRKYNLESGQILLDGKHIAKFDLLDYRQNIGVVPQGVTIFNATLVENILCGRNHKTTDDLIRRIESIGLKPFLSRFRLGLFTFLGEDGHQLSGGEKQILGIIRALLDEPQILIIDEGINAIDIEMEYQVFQLLKDYAKTHLVLLVSHNLRTVIKADHINILQNGEIIQCGSLQELMKSNGYFNHLWKIFQQTNEKEKDHA